MDGTYCISERNEFEGLFKKRGIAMRLAEVDRDSREALELAGEEVLPEGYRIEDNLITTGQLKLWTAHQLRNAGVTAWMLKALGIYLAARGLAFRDHQYPGTGNWGPDWKMYCRIRDAEGEERDQLVTIAAPVCWEWETCLSSISDLAASLSTCSRNDWDIQQVTLLPDYSGQEMSPNQRLMLVIARRPWRGPDQSPPVPTDLGAPPE